MNGRNQKTGPFTKGLAVSSLLLIVVVVVAGRGLLQRRGDLARELSRTFSATAEAAMPAVVSIRVARAVEGGPVAKAGDAPAWNDPYALFNNDLVTRLFGEEAPQKELSHNYVERNQGSGFIISADGYILTNNHVVGNADWIAVELQDGRTFMNAKLIGTDPESEVALIKIDGENFPVLPMGDSSKVEIGDWVIAIGNPFGLSATVTVGVISAVGRSNINIAAYEDFIQTDAAINPGNSGGPLIDLNGHAIGVNTAILSKSGNYAGVGFAIPTNMARGIAEQLKHEGKVSRGYLGVLSQEVKADMVGLLGLTEASGLLVSDVTRDSPAQKAGLKVHDVIIEIDGRKVESSDGFKNDVAALRPGSNIRMAILRNGKPLDLSAVVGERPTAVPRIRQAPQEVDASLELQVQALTEELAARLGYQVGEGLIISSLSRNSGVAEAGMQVGDLVVAIDGRHVASVDEFIAAIQRAQENGKAIFLIKRGRTASFIVVYLE